MRTCVATGKIVYATEEAAWAQAKRMHRKHRMSFKHFLCKSCNSYHLARIKKREKPDESLPD